MQKLEVTVRLSDKQRNSLDDVVSRLESAGLSNISCSKRFGIVHGEVEASNQDTLRRVEGVASVRTSQIFKTL